jgi:transcriptional regulator GlxA family with amidase domain
MGRDATLGRAIGRSKSTRLRCVDPLEWTPTRELRAALVTDPVLRPIEAMLDRPPCCTRVLACLAKRLGRRAEFIRDRVRSRTGLDVTLVMRAAQWRRAAMRLRDTDDKAHVIAVAEGFSDATAFGRAFRRATRRTPSEYRLAARDRKMRDILAGRTPLGTLAAGGPATP